MGDHRFFAFEGRGMAGGVRCGVVVKGVRSFNDGDTYTVYPEDLDIAILL